MKLDADRITHKGRAWNRRYYFDKVLGLTRYEWEDDLGFIAGPKLRRILNGKAANI